MNLTSMRGIGWPSRGSSWETSRKDRYGIPVFISTHCLPPDKMHAGVILAQDVREYAPLFSEIADAYFDQKMYTEAVLIYEELGQDPSVRHSDLLLQLLLSCNWNRRAASMFWSEPPLVVE